MHELILKSHLFFPIVYQRHHRGTKEAEYFEFFLWESKVHEKVFIFFSRIIILIDIDKEN